MKLAGHPITDAWRPLAKHAEGCARCAVAVAELARVPEDPARVDGAAHERLCEDGRDAFQGWWEAKHELLEATTALRRRQFLLRHQLWDDHVTFEQRAEAIMSMPGPDFHVWLALDDEPRHAQLRALESARAVGPERTESPERAGQSVSTEDHERACANPDCGVRFVPDPQFPRQRFHSPACRKRASRRHLEPTE